MNRNKLKVYAPQARRDFIRAMTDRAAFYGLSEGKIEPITEKGDVAVIAGTAFPVSVVAKRRLLEARIKRDGFAQVMEAMAYTWFNRLVAIRFMELHGYLDHGYRVLSHPEGNITPEIVEHAEHVDFPGLDKNKGLNKNKVIELKLEGTKEAELYRMLLVAQCNALHSAMPFLFEQIDDETELLLPDSLLHSDSPIRQLVSEIDEEDWKEVEIIGWLYQFYISEKKDEVIGKVVKSEDIPAATQLFTPNWIVKYLVQNTLGRQWMATYPNSPLRGQMEYYIEPAEQTPDVQAKLTEITPTSLNPEELTLLDPACGSGHIMVEAYDLLKSIYQERGYRAKDIPRLILEKNLFGLEIDDRAAQLAAFALMMKARADDRSIFERRVQPHVVSIQESKGLDAKEITEALNVPILKEDLPPSGELFEEIADEKSPLFSRKHLSVAGNVPQADVATLINLFEQGKTFGSLLLVPDTLTKKLPSIAQRVEGVIAHGSMFEKAAAMQLRPLLKQTMVLVANFDHVVTNPPYMGAKYYSGRLKELVANHYKEAKADLYACFIQRNLGFAKPNGFVGMITIPNWMFLSSFEGVRSSLFDHQSIDTFVHNGRGVFGSDFGSCSFVLRNHSLPTYRGVFRRLFDKQGSVASNEALQERFFTSKAYVAAPADFRPIPSFPLAYWISSKVRDVFARSRPLSEVGTPRQGVATADNNRFLRRWYEVSISTIGFSYGNSMDAARSGKKWFPHNKGGDFRKWSGNLEYVINWQDDGKEIRNFSDENGRVLSRPQNTEFFFREGVTWSHTSIATLSVRYSSVGMTFNCEGPTFFSNRPFVHLGFMGSSLCAYLMNIMNPAVHFLVGSVALLPYDAAAIERVADSVEVAVREMVEVAAIDWNTFETSWGFQLLPLRGHNSTTLKKSQDDADAECEARFARLKRLEEDNNRLFIEAYGLQAELSPIVPDEQITLYRPDREEDIKRLMSYSIGCMMGRYSLDERGLIYAHSGNQNFDRSKYQMFPADEDGIIPLTESNWFADDGSSRFEMFLATAWPTENLEENLTFVAEGLGSKKDESPRDTIRRYFATDFFKHHLSMYKRRPIYWLFSSGKQRAFQALVYLHRYNEGTLARMRTEYVIPLQGKISARIEQLAGDIASATSSAFRSKLTKERDSLVKQQAELQTFDETLRHYADLRITLDLDDGVKVNYGKFGDLLAEVKAVTGGKDDD